MQQHLSVFVLLWNWGLMTPVDGHDAELTARLYYSWLLVVLTETWETSREKTLTLDRSRRYLSVCCVLVVGCVCVFCQRERVSEIRVWGLG